MSSINYPPDFQRISGFKKFSVLVTGASMLASLIILIGLTFNFYPFRGLIVGMGTTKPLGSPLGAVGFLSASTALLLLQRVNGKEKSWQRVLGLICAGLTFLIGGTVLLEYMLGADFGIDSLLLRDAVLSSPGISPGRPIFLVSVCQTILGLALLALYSKAREIDLFVFGTLFVGLIAMIEYIYGSAHLASLGSSRPFPLPSALLLIFISMGYLTARPESHFMAPISSPLAGGLFSRRFFPAAILLPLLLGWLEIVGQKVGLYTIEFGRVLFSASNILVFIGLVYWNIKKLNEIDIQRGATNIALRQSEERFRTLIDATPVGQVMVEPGGEIVLANASAQSLFGYEPGQLTGKTIETLLPERFRDRHPMFRRLFETEIPPRMSITGRNLVGLRRDGSEFPAEISLTPMETSEGRFTLASITDITERKQAEDEIRSLNATLEQRVAERTQQLQFERGRWQRIVEGMADEVWSCDAEGRMSLLNMGQPSVMGLEPFKDKSVEEIYQEVEILYPDGQLRPPNQAPLLLSLRGEIVRGEEIMRHRQTDIKRYRQYSSAPIHDETGAITGAVAIVRDITEQKRAKEVISRYDLLSASSKDIVLFVHRESHNILEANAAAIKAYGYSRDELLKLKILDLRAPETNPMVQEQMEQADSGGILFETIHVRKDGSTFPVEVSSQGATINGVRTLISVIRDITERKQAEQALHQSEERFALAFHASPVGINIFRFADGRSVDANEAFLSLTGYSRDEVIGHSGAELNLFVNTEQRAEWMREVNEHGAVRNLDVQIRKKNGEIASALFSLVKIDFGGESMGLTMAIDITRRKKAEAALQQSEENFSKAFKSSPAALMITRISDGLFMELNESYGKIVGYEREELLGHRTTDFDIYIQSTDRQKIVEQLKTLGSVHNHEINIRHRSGGIRHVMISQEMITFNGEEAVISTLLDITDRKKAEEALRDSDEKLRTVLKNSNLMLSQSDRELRYLWIYNPHPDFEPSKMLGKRDDELQDSEGARRLVARKQQVIESGEGAHDEIDFYLSNGIRTMDFTIEPLFDQNGSTVGTTSVIVDVTESKRAEAQLAYQARLLSQVSDAVVGTDENLQITYWNASAERLFGWMAEEVLGAETREILKSQVAGTSPEKALLKLMETDKFDGEMHYVRKNGEYFIAHALSVVMRGPEGNFKGLVITIRDITERKRVENALRASEERYRAVIENARDAILVSDPSGAGRILAANPAACRMFGYTQKEFLKVNREMMVDLNDPNLAILMKQREKSGHATIELQYKRKNGERFLGELSSVFYKDKNEQTQSISIIRDVTERKQLEDALRESEQKYTLLFEKSAVATTLLLLPEEVIMDVNEACEKLTGFTRQEVFGKTAAEFGIGEARDRAEIISEFEQFGRLTGNETRIITKNGDAKFVVFNTAPIKLNGQLYAISTMLDVTERRRAEEELRRSQQLLQAIIDNTQAPIYVKDLDGRLIVANQPLAQVYGMSVQEVLGKTSREIVGNLENANAHMTNDLQVLQLGQPFMFEEFTSDRVFLSLKFPLRDAQGHIFAVGGVSTDITERKRTEEQLAKLTNRLSLATHAARMGIWDWNILTNKSDWNEQMYVLYGLKPSEAEGGYDVWVNGIHPEDRGYSQEAVQQALRGEGEYNTEHRVLWPDGSVHWLKAHGQVFRDQNGTPVRMLGVNYEITELKQAEMTILESEERFSTAFYSNPVPQAVTTQEGNKILAVNDGFCKLFEYSHEELLGGTTAKLQIWENEAVREAAVKEFMTTGHIRSRETTIKTRSGQMRTVIASITPISWKGLPCVISSAIDITARKQAEEQITAALQEKEVLLKEVHHRVKNNLQVISSLLRLQSSGVSDPTVRELFTESQRRVRAMALIHEQLYQSANLAQINLRDYITSLVSYLRHSYAQTISKVETQINIEDSIIEMDRAMPIGLLVSELVSNSLKYAFPANAQQQDGKIWVNAEQGENGLTLTIGDNGVGLPDELDIEHTTSMGLQLVDSFVTQLQGQLTVQRKPGTVFTIFIPNKG